MRGLLCLCFEKRRCRRITPAHAGTTPLPQGRRHTSPDHPRACGDYIFTFYSYIGAPGSPPRMRGLLLSAKCQTLLKRITPAHAGTTSLRRGREKRQGDHPRACGDYSGGGMEKSTRKGSPPRMRGLRDDNPIPYLKA